MVPAELYQRVRISYHEETREDGERELGVLEGTAAELGLRPLSLVVHAVPQSPAEPEISPDDIVGLGYRRTLRGVSGESALPSKFVIEQERNGGVTREWLEIETTSSGHSPVRSRRVLFDAAHSGRTPAEPRPFRRYSISVLPGPVPPAWLSRAG